MPQPEHAWQRKAFIPASRKESPEPADPAAPPIYRALAATWAAQGRTLPGGPDREWRTVAARPCWPV